MNAASFSEFVAMGGYATYVWGAYGVTALALALEAWLVARRLAAAHRRAGAGASDARRMP